MKQALLLTLVLATSLSGASTTKPRFKVIAFYTTTVEPDHVHFANDAIKYFTQLAQEKNFEFDTTTDWSNLKPEFLKDYKVVMWLNEFPQNQSQRTAFEDYMKGGGAWLGCHVAGYNDKYIPLHRYFIQAMDLMYAHLRQGRPLPPSQVVHTTPRGQGAPTITTANVPPIADAPPSTALITFSGGQVRIPD